MQTDFSYFGKGAGAQIFSLNPAKDYARKPWYERRVAWIVMTNKNIIAKYFIDLFVSGFFPM